MDIDRIGGLPNCLLIMGLVFLAPSSFIPIVPANTIQFEVAKMFLE